MRWVLSFFFCSMIVRDIYHHVEQNVCGIWFFGGFRGFPKDPWQACCSWNSVNVLFQQLISLQASSPGKKGAGWEMEEELATTSLELILNSSSVVPRRLSCQFSDNQNEAEISANINTNWKTRSKGNAVITNAISANQHFASTFSMQIFKFHRDVIASSPSFCQSAP